MRLAPSVWLVVSALALFALVPVVPPQYASPLWAFGWLSMAAALAYFLDLTLFRGRGGESQRPRDFVDWRFVIAAWYRRAVIIAATMLSWAIVAGGAGGL